MRKHFWTLIVLLILSACGQRQSKNTQHEISVFKIFLHPSVDEKAQIILTKNNTQQIVHFLILDREFANKPIDTFYQRTISLSKEQYNSFDSLVIKKAKVKQPHQWTGCCDGMPVEYFTITGTDTSKLYFRSPDIKSDSSGYVLTKLAVDKLRIIYNDSIITDYLNDIESYMDESKHHTDRKENRPINRLRKVEYSR